MNEMSNPSDRTIFEELLATEPPEVVQLGQAVSLAIRIEPALLRRARLTAVPHLDVSVEADLTFSPLVAQATAEGFVFEPIAAKLLRAGLARDPVRLQKARTLVAADHRRIPPTVRLEEEIVWYAVSRPGSSAEIEALLARTIAVLKQNPAKEQQVAWWFAGRARYLPQAARDTESHTLLVFLVSALLGGKYVDRLQRLDPQLVPRLTQLLANTPRTKIWAGLVPEGLILETEAHTGFIPLELPLTRPLVVTVASELPLQAILLRPGATTTVPVKGPEVEVVTASGRGYRLRRRREREKERNDLIAGRWAGFLADAAGLKHTRDIILPGDEAFEVESIRSRQGTVTAITKILSMSHLVSPDRMIIYGLNRDPRAAARP